MFVNIHLASALPCFLKEFVMLRDFGRRTRTLASDSETMLLLNIESSRSVEILEVHNDEPKENSASTTIDVVSSQCKDRDFSLVFCLLWRFLRSLCMYCAFLCGMCSCFCIIFVFTFS